MIIPTYISVFFIVTTLLTIALFYRISAQVSTKTASKIAIGLAIWMILQGILSVNGFYLKTDSMPPRFALAVVPAILTILYFFMIPQGRAFFDRLSLKGLTMLHVCRVPVELVLLWLFLYRQVPQSMTFEGSNFDILSGLTAVPMAWFAFRTDPVKRMPLLIWNIICLGLVLNVVSIGIFSAPSPMQQWAFDQPNIGVLQFPFVWLPSVIVPLVILSHLIAIRRFLLKTITPSV